MWCWWGRRDWRLGIRDWRLEIRDWRLSFCRRFTQIDADFFLFELSAFVCVHLRQNLQSPVNQSPISSQPISNLQFSNHPSRIYSSHISAARVVALAFTP